MKQWYASTFFVLMMSVVAVALAACTPAPIAGEPRDPRVRLTLAGVPVPPAVLLTQMTRDEALGAVTEAVEFIPVDDLEGLRRGIEAGQIHAGLASTSALAVLRNDGVPVQLMDVVAWELLYLLAGEKEIDGWESLRGSKVAVAYRGSVTDVIFSHLAAQADLSIGDDLVMRYATNPLEAAEVLAGKQVQAAVLGEPWATVAIADGEEVAEPIHRVMNLQDEWSVLLGTESRIPQVAFFVTDELAAEQPELVTALHAALVEAAAWLEAEPAAAAAAAARLTRLSEAVAAESLAFTGIDIVPAAEARPELEQLFRVLAAANPELIGGALPDDGFYGASGK